MEPCGYMTGHAREISTETLFGREAVRRQHQIRDAKLLEVRRQADVHLVQTRFSATRATAGLSGQPKQFGQIQQHSANRRARRRFAIASGRLATASLVAALLDCVEPAHVCSLAEDVTIHRF
jgi:hypothetical protein